MNEIEIGFIIPRICRSRWHLEQLKYGTFPEFDLAAAFTRKMSRNAAKCPIAKAKGTIGNTPNMTEVVVIFLQEKLIKHDMFLYAGVTIDTNLCHTTINKRRCDVLEQAKSCRG